MSTWRSIHCFGRTLCLPAMIALAAQPLCPLCRLLTAALGAPSVRPRRAATALLRRMRWSCS